MCNDEDEPKVINVIYNYIKALIFIVIIVSIAIFFSYCFYNFILIHQNLFLIIATIFFLWAIIGKMGWEIQTLSGNTLAESLNIWIFRIFSLLGSLLLFLVYFSNVLFD